MAWIVEQPPSTAEAESYVYKDWVFEFWRFVTFNYQLVTVDSADTILYSARMEDAYIFVDTTTTNVTVTLPNAEGNKSKIIVIKKRDTSGNTITVARRDSETIEGASSDSITGSYTVVKYISDNSNWWIW